LHMFVWKSNICYKLKVASPPKKFFKKTLTHYHHELSLEVHNAEWEEEQAQCLVKPKTPIASWFHLFLSANLRLSQLIRIEENLCSFEFETFLADQKLKGNLLIFYQ
jgi:hypothetical protein